MVKHTIKGSHTSYSITESGDTWIFTRNATVISNNSDAVTATGAVNTRIVVEGLISTVSGAYAGIRTSGTNVDIDVAQGGRIISSSYGIVADAVGSRIMIAGRVEGSAALYSNAANLEIDIARGGKFTGNTGYSLISSGDNLSIDNGGTITGRLSLSGYGVEVRNNGMMKVDPNFPTIVSHDDDMHFVNEKSGSIVGGFQIETTAGESSSTVNHGHIRSDSWVFISYSGDDRLKNDGNITGNISLGAGKDVADLRGGMLDGFIRGGFGDDILITDNAKYVLQEYDGEGEDIIRSTVSYKLDPTYYIERLELIGTKNAKATGTARSEELWGNAGNNVLNGKGGYDYFDGRAGSDLLKSADDGAENRFYFRTGYDRDTIQYFDIGLDTIYLDGWRAIDDFADLRSHARNRGDDVVITAGHDSLTIRDMHKSDLQADDFFLG